MTIAGQYWGLPERSGRQVKSYPQSIPSYHGPRRSHPGMNSRPVEAAVLRPQSHPIITNLPGGPRLFRLRNERLLDSATISPHDTHVSKLGDLQNLLCPRVFSSHKR
jgi:hypothetical protein